MDFPRLKGRSVAAVLRIAARLSLAYLSLTGIAAAQVSVNTGGTGNGIVMNVGTDPGAASSAVSIFADTTSGRAKIYNNGAVSSQPLAIWPCTMAGCIMFGANSSPHGETALQPMGSQGVPLLAGSSTSGIPQWGATTANSFLDLQANALTTEITNASGGPLRTSS